MTRLRTFIALCWLVVAPLYAQSTYSSFVPTLSVSAAVYGGWSLAGQAANTYTFTPTTLCTVHGMQGLTYPAFSSLGGVAAPVYINDTGTPSNSEIVTPSAVLTCGVTVSPAHTHTTFSLQSGTAGLQEALNALAASAVLRPAVINLDVAWYAQAVILPGTTPAAIVAAAKGSPAAYLEDTTTSPPTYYVWNGTAYATGTWTNASPSVTAGAAAGTGPAISVVAGSAAMKGTVQLTTGTATTTGTLYTLTWPSTGSFQYAPTCTVQSVGSNSFTAFTTATAYSSQATLTVTATSAPAVSTVYLFSYSCL